MASKLESAESAILRDLRLKRLNRTWAKVEILIGLVALAIGAHELGSYADQPETLPLIGIALIVLGLYLALAGHRSHLYQAQTRLAAYVLSRQADSAEPQ